MNVTLLHAAVLDVRHGATATTVTFDAHDPQSSCLMSATQELHRVYLHVNGRHSLLPERLANRPNSNHSQSDP